MMTYPSRLSGRVPPPQTPPPQTPPPRKQKTHVTSPIFSDDFSDMPEYVPTTRTRRAGQIRGRDGVEELAQIVGSAKFRDIKRSANFMPGQFYIWNDAEKGGNKKYWGGYQDVDDDGLAHEFVVRRGGSTGPMIAVNGYTTKRSDWAARRAFFEEYPNRKQRKDKTVRSYMQEEYYKPHYNGMVIDGWELEPGSERDEFRDEEWKRYRKYTPKNLSPYQAVNKYIVQPALDQYLAAMKMTKTQYLAMYGGVGALSRLASEIYFSLVKAPVTAYLVNKKLYHDLERDFLALRGGEKYRENCLNYEAELDKYVFSRKSVKDLVSRYVGNIVLPQAKTLIKAYASKIDGDHLSDSPAPIPSPQIDDVDDDSM